MLLTNGHVPFFPARRGVLLLIVLALLAMFGLVAVAFVVLTGQAQRRPRASNAFNKATN